MAIPFAHMPAISLVARHNHPAELLTTIQDIAELLTAPVVAAEEAAWRAGLTRRLSDLRRAFTEHVRVTEGPEGLYAELVDCAPRLVRAVGLLTREHATINAVIEATADRTGDAAIGDLRRWAGDLLRALSRHRQRGADLVYDALETDIGGET